MKKIFCITGMTGSGKSTFILELNKLIKENNKSDIIKPLVYCTTRKPRGYEVNNRDYVFTTEEEMNNNSDNIIEKRKYEMTTGTVYYYTTKQCLEGSDNFITAASIEQLANYINSPVIDVYEIRINCSLKNRISRVMNNRCKTDEDVYELCRRVLQERIDYSVPEVVDTVNRLNHPHWKLEVDNNFENVNDSLYGLMMNYSATKLIYDWILERI